jgi:hypothetical protein
VQRHGRGRGGQAEVAVSRRAVEPVQLIAVGGDAGGDRVDERAEGVQGVVLDRPGRR